MSVAPALEVLKLPIAAYLLPEGQEPGNQSRS